MDVEKKQVAKKLMYISLPYFSRSKLPAYISSYYSNKIVNVVMQDTINIKGDACELCVHVNFFFLSNAS